MIDDDKEDDEYFDIIPNNKIEKIAQKAEKSLQGKTLKILDGFDDKKYRHIKEKTHKKKNKLLDPAKNNDLQ